jgi:uncharacterized membrane protein YuzA (DUF378 family)
MKWLHMVAFLLTAIGGINWGLIGLFKLNLVYMLLGGMPTLERVVYILVGASAVVLLATHMGDCKVCSKMKM